VAQVIGFGRGAHSDDGIIVQSGEAALLARSTLPVERAAILDIPRSLSKLRRFRPGSGAGGGGVLLLA
jgi:hypothetical protein